MAMTLEKLKKMLSDGAIDQDEYKDMLEKFGLKEEDPQLDDPFAGLDEKQKSALQKYVQSEKDKEANRVGNLKKGELDEVKKQLKELQDAKLTDDEKKKLEKDQLDKERMEFAVVKNKYAATQALKAAGMDNGEDVVNLVIGIDEETTKNNVKTLSDIVDRLVKAKVAEKFKDSGRDPGKGGSGAGAGEDNPWMKDHINFTKQMEIEATDPELAKQLRAAAGIK